MRPHVPESSSWSPPISSTSHARSTVLSSSLGSMLGPALQRLGAEVVELRQAPDGLDDGLTAVRLAGHRVQLAADDVLFRLVVARDADGPEVVDVALEHVEVQIHRVARDDLHRRLHAEAQVALVLVEARHVVLRLVAVEVLVEALVVEHVALGDGQRVVERLVGIQRVALPLDVAHVVLRPLVDFDFEYHLGLALVYAHVRRVARDVRVVVAAFVVEGDEVVEVFVELVLFEGRVPPEFPPRLGLGVLERLAEALVGHLVVARDHDLADLHALPPVYGEQHVEAAVGVGGGRGGGVGEGEALLRVKLLDDHLGPPEVGVGQARAPDERQLLAEVVAPAFLDVLEAVVAQTRCLGHVDPQEDAIAHASLLDELDVGEEVELVDVVQRLRELGVEREGDLLPCAEAAGLQHDVARALGRGALDGHAEDFVGGGFGSRLRPHRQRGGEHAERGKEETMEHQKGRRVTAGGGAQSKRHRPKGYCAPRQPREAAGTRPKRRSRPWKSRTAS